MIRVIEINNTKIRYDSQYKKVKNINLRIKSDGSINVSANRRVPQKAIDEFVMSKAEFIIRALDKYKSKVNFFSMSWKQDEMDANAQEEFSMRSFMRGNRIRYADELDETSNPNEAYLRTWGWSEYVSVWYLYFRKVNFPLDPDIHGNWEWAGIYMGNKL